MNYNNSYVLLIRAALSCLLEKRKFSVNFCYYLLYEFSKLCLNSLQYLNLIFFLVKGIKFQFTIEFGEDYQKRHNTYFQNNRYESTDERNP